MKYNFNSKSSLTENISPKDCLSDRMELLKSTYKEVQDDSLE